MTDFIVSVVVYVLRHVFVEDLKCFSKRVVPASTWYFAILNSAKFVVLLPKIGFNNFSSGKPAQDVNVV